MQLVKYEHLDMLTDRTKITQLILVTVKICTISVKQTFSTSLQVT